ncbi:putative reverse transcriptase domain-containing protein [Tanacetum coccineum]
MNEKSKDTAKARQDLKRLGIRSGLWLSQTKNGKCSKPQAAYSFTPENRKKFCQFIKGVKLPDAFGSNFKHKQYLPDEVAKPIIKLCLFFKQICYATLMEDDMLKAQSKVVDILCNLKLIYPPAFFDIMIHLVTHLPLEALEGGHINFLTKTRKKNFPTGWSQIRQRYVDNDLGVSATSELFALACGPTPTPISVNSYVVNGVRFVVHSRDERRTTQNSSICSLGGKDGEMYYGQLQEILEFFYLSFKVVLFRVKWFDTSNEGQEDPDVIHFDNSSDLLLSTSLSDLDNATLHIDGQSTEVDAPPDIIDLDEDDDIINDEDALPHDLADSDDEDLVNVDDDGVDVMSADVARGHGGDGGGDCKGTLKPNLGARKADRLHTLQETRNLGLKKITDDKDPVPIRFEWDDKKTMMPLEGPDVAEGDDCDKDWDTILLAASHAIPVLGRYQCGHLTTSPKVNDPRNQARAVQNRQNRAKSTVVFRQGSRSLARLRDEMMESSETREYLSLIDTFFVTHTINGVFIRDEDRAIYEEMLRQRALGSNTESGVPYTDEEINALARKGKQRGHLPGVGRVLPGRARDVNLMMKLFRNDDKFSQMLNQYESTPEFGSSSGGCGDDEMADDEDGDEDEEDEEDGDS